MEAAIASLPYVQAARRRLAKQERIPSRRVARRMFLFFSNRTGCLGSLLITALGTFLLLWLMGWIGRP